MQTLRFPSIPTVHSSFQRHRKSIDRSRFALNLSLCTPAKAPNWAPLPTPPMSGSPPPDPFKDPSQLAGRRRKRSDTPPEDTTAVASSLPTLFDHTIQRYGEQQVSASRPSIDPTMQIATQTIPYLPPLTYGAVPAAPLTHYSPPGVISNPLQVSPRSTRKTKAHVASACINCKKKHLRCDSSRPCRRCVQGGKEDTCKDVEHKKRGRPPLKPEDPSTTARTARGPGPSALGPFHGHIGTTHGGDTQIFAASNYPPILPSAPSSMYGHGRSSSRTSLYGGLQSPYAAPSIAPSPMTATATGFSYSTRPQSTSSNISTQPPSPYVSHPGYLSQGLPRQGHSFTGYTYHPVEMPPSSQALYPSPIFPREQMAQPLHGDSQYHGGLQLPPIRPSPQSPVDPAISQPITLTQQTHRQDTSRRQESGERDAKRPKMDIQGILGPRHD